MQSFFSSGETLVTALVQECPATFCPVVASGHQHSSLSSPVFCTQHLLPCSQRKQNNLWNTPEPQKAPAAFPSLSQPVPFPILQMQMSFCTKLRLKLEVKNLHFKNNSE
jgi:hypothetical protein